MTTKQKLIVLTWALVISGNIIIFFSDDTTVDFIGACIWLAGVIIQLVVGGYWIVRWYVRKD